MHGSQKEGEKKVRARTVVGCDRLPGFSSRSPQIFASTSVHSCTKQHTCYVTNHVQSPRSRSSCHLSSFPRCCNRLTAANTTPERPRPSQNTTRQPSTHMRTEERNPSIERRGRASQRDTPNRKEISKDKCHFLHIGSLSLRRGNDTSPSIGGQEECSSAYLATRPTLQCSWSVCSSNGTAGVWYPLAIDGSFAV